MNFFLQGMASHNLLHQGMASHNGSEISVLISKVAWSTTGFQKTAGFWNLSLLEVAGCPLVGASSCERPIKVTGQHQSLGEQLLMSQQAGTR